MSGLSGLPLRLPHWGHLLAMRILIVYDNVARPPFREGWGFSAFVEIGGRRILFDAGADRMTLSHNARLLGLDFSSLTDIFISHAHCDHVGGLSQVLEAAEAARIWAPLGMREYLCSRARRQEVIIVGKARALGDGLWSTGTMGKAVAEQGLVIAHSGQRILLTGCAHPGVDRLARRAAELVGAPLTLILGGFHLEGASPRRLENLVERLRPLAEALAPGHCTGDESLEFLHASFPKVIPLEVGKTFSWEEG